MMHCRAQARSHYAPHVNDGTGFNWSKEVAA